MTNKQQKTYMRKFTKLSIINRVEVMKEHGKLFYKLKQKNEQLEVYLLSYIAFMQAISFCFDDETYLTSFQISQIENNTKRLHLKSEILIEKWALLRELKQKLSFRKIPIYLRKHHNIEVSHSTVYRIYKELNKDMKENNG